APPPSALWIASIELCPSLVSKRKSAPSGPQNMVARLVLPTPASPKRENDTRGLFWTGLARPSCEPEAPMGEELESELRREGRRETGMYISKGKRTHTH